jgi:hypothetical protein
MVNSYHSIVVLTDNKVSYLEGLPTLRGGIEERQLLAPLERPPTELDDVGL